VDDVEIVGWLLIGLTLFALFLIHWDQLRNGP
jgi:hypothetical protein